MSTVRRRRELQLMLDRYVIRRVCTAMADWHRAGLLHCPIAINVCGENVVNGQVHRMIQECVQASGCPTDRLEIEVGEGSLLGDRDATRSALEALRTMGVRVCVDDLGATLSSLDYLRELPIDGLKLDRAFLRNLDNPHTCSIVRAVVSLARSMRIEVTAAGVQTLAQERFAVDCRCHALQGYRFGPPFTHRQVERQLTRRRRPDGTEGGVRGEPGTPDAVPQVTGARILHLTEQAPSRLTLVN
jgi:EAL domain-containing protein (putative c-di-GMP-specific phosphodiesterase class I)